MSKFVELAQEIEQELANIKDQNNYLAAELHSAHKKNKQIVSLIKNFLAEVQEVIDDELWPLPKYLELLFIR
jgi:glutamine synthetase type III